MRNGINVAAVSELVHEIRHVEGENEIHYGVDLKWLGGLTMQLSTCTLRFGNKRMGRDFRFIVDHYANPNPTAAPCPVDFFLNGVGACVANILVQGASYKEISIKRLNVQVNGKIQANQTQSEGIKDGTINVDLDADGKNWQYKIMMMNASRFSPNYMTAKRANSIDLHYQHLPVSLHQGTLFNKDNTVDSTVSYPKFNEGILNVSVDINWEDGTQFKVGLLQRQWQEQSWSSASRFNVDQPSAALGLNGAPNPQEYILSAVAADVAQNLIIIAAENDKALLNLSAKIQCKLDMRGCFNIFDKSAVQLQDTTLHIAAMSHATEQEIQDYIELACQRSACWQSFVNPCPISLQRVKT